VPLTVNFKPKEIIATLATQYMCPRCTLELQIDAFTPVPFGGNPAAVVLLPQSALPLSDSLRQQIAAEKNLSETAFLECVGDGDDFGACTRFKLRWFTPAIEVPLVSLGTGGGKDHAT
jgi:PhzF family phenazine biosynthesis protein